MIAGPPVDLSEFDGKPLDSATLRAATDKIMSEVAALVGKLRGEDPPAQPYHPAVARRRERAELRKLAAQHAEGGDQPTDPAASQNDSPPANGSDAASEVPGP